jgi:rhomboid family GlyGly-CTERM serine protease
MKYKKEIFGIALLLSLLNLPVLFGEFSRTFILQPNELLAGEWWRLLTFPWVHISMYHLALDASAFIFLYQTLRAGFKIRLQHLLLCILGSGVVPLLLDPRLATIGLCGLSGVAHGLMLICALEAASESDKAQRLVAASMFLVVLGKTIFEQITGDVMFAAHHLGNVGTPIASCHFGGLIGALLSFVLANWMPKLKSSPGGRRAFEMGNSWFGN